LIIFTTGFPEGKVSLVFLNYIIIFQKLPYVFPFKMREFAKFPKIFQKNGSCLNFRNFRLGDWQKLFLPKGGQKKFLQ